MNMLGYLGHYFILGTDVLVLIRPYCVHLSILFIFSNWLKLYKNKFYFVLAYK